MLTDFGDHAYLKVGLGWGGVGWDVNVHVINVHL